MCGRSCMFFANRTTFLCRFAVAPLTGRVDRNYIALDEVTNQVSRAPHGARGSKSGDLQAGPEDHLCRAPHGARGSKFVVTVFRPTTIASRPSRGAWIEMLKPNIITNQSEVAPLTGRVDRNLLNRFKQTPICVAPLTGRVDRNLLPDTLARVVPKRRAPHGARGSKSDDGSFVAPSTASRPSRGAWIEILTICGHTPHTIVAPLTGRVDRNNELVKVGVIVGSRAPHGARGSK